MSGLDKASIVFQSLNSLTDLARTAAEWTKIGTGLNKDKSDKKEDLIRRLLN